MQPRLLPRDLALAFAGALAATLVLWGPGLAAFPVYDDISILAHASPLGGVSPGGVWTQTLSGFWRPLPLTLCWLVAWAAGLEPLALHAPTVLLHALNAALVALVASQHGLGRRASLLAALAFATHFAAWTAVAALQTIMDVMLATWVLAAVAATPSWWTPAALARVLALQVLAILTKETSLVFPLVVALAWWARRASDESPQPLREGLRSLAPVAALAVVQAILVWQLQRGGEYSYAQQGAVSLSPVTAARQLADHALSLAFPFIHVAELPFHAIVLPGAALWALRALVLVALVLLAWGVKLSRTRPGAALALAGIALLLPVTPLSGAPQGRFLYPALPLVVLGAALLIARLGGRSQLAAIVLVAALHALMLPSFHLSPTTMRYRQGTAEVGAFAQQFTAMSEAWRDGESVAIAGHPHPGPPEFRQLYANGLARILLRDKRVTIVTGDDSAHADHRLAWVDGVLADARP